MKEIKGPETYKAIAEVLPWEIQTGLLSLRDAEDNPAEIEKVFKKMPTTVYIAIQELCLATPWDTITRRGLKLTTAGKHLAEYCTC